MVKSRSRRHALALITLGLVLVLAACGGSAAAGGASTGSPGSGGPGSSNGPAAGNGSSGSEASGSSTGSLLEREGGLCKYVPLDEAEAALGAPVVAAKAKKSYLGLGYSCRLTANEQTVLDVNWSEEESLAEFKEAFEKVGLEETIEGLGEFAYHSEGTPLGDGARLAVYTGERHISLMLYATGDQATMDAATEAIARALLGSGL
jgi:hypothetical protein